MYICVCEAITDDELKEIIDNGAHSMDAVVEACFAGTNCGKCVEEIEQIIRDRIMLVETDTHLLRVKEIAENIQYKDWNLRIERDNSNEGGRVFLQWTYNSSCAVDGEQAEWHCRKWYLSPYMLESEVVKTAFAAALAGEEHETREKFVYKDVAPFNPHISLEVMIENARRYTTRQNPIDESQVG